MYVFVHLCMSVCLSLPSLSVWCLASNSINAPRSKIEISDSCLAAPYNVSNAYKRFVIVSFPLSPQEHGLLLIMYSRFGPASIDPYYFKINGAWLPRCSCTARFS
ncbi:hypothetical protein F4810DRAFT_544049 [Camillea tinctor]|nr:hypothetical protein F4810DRAFT_544049 [Camillea tinctor]